MQYVVLWRRKQHIAGNHFASWRHLSVSCQVDLLDFCAFLWTVNILTSVCISSILFSINFKVLLRRIWPIIKSFFRLWSFPLFLWPNCLTLGWYCWENCIHENFKLFYSTFGVQQVSCAKSPQWGHVFVNVSKVASFSMIKNIKLVDI